MTPAPYTGADHEDLERLWALAERRPPVAFDEAFDMLEHGTPRAVAWQAFQDFTPTGRMPLASRNPYAFEEWLEENGVDRWSDVPWGDQLADHYQRTKAAEAPKIDTSENPALHMVHSACQDGNEFYVTHCGIAVEPSGQRTDPDVAAVEKPMCPECIAVLRASTVCAICGLDLA